MRRPFWGPLIQFTLQKYCFFSTYANFLALFCIFFAFLLFLLPNLLSGHGINLLPAQDINLSLMQHFHRLISIRLQILNTLRSRTSGELYIMISAYRIVKFC